MTVNQIVFDDDIYSDTGLIAQVQSNEVPDLYFQWAGTTVDGKIYMVPISIDLTNTIWHTTTIFAENRLTAPATSNDFLAAIKGLADAGETPIITASR